MLLSRLMFYQLSFLVAQVATLAITHDQNVLDSTPTIASTASLEVSETHTLTQPTSPTIPIASTEPPAVTEPPSSSSNGADLVRRQPCCFNDQGFRVDCATWTGYYYTWGPQSNPYEGGPQCDGNWNGGSGNGGGSGSGNGQGSGSGGQVAVLNAADKDGLRWEMSFVVGLGLLGVAAWL